MTSAQDLARSLLSAHAVRERASAIYALAQRNGLVHFTIDETKIASCAAFVLDVMRQNYPTLDIPYHARWRHFAAGGLDRWGSLERQVAWGDRARRARAAFDLAIVSVLLDAGAGPAWHYHDANTGQSFARSEGLAVASFDMFAAGTFSATNDPLRADATALMDMTEETIAVGFQVSDANPLLGLAGRTALIRRLGETVAASPAVFAQHDAPRPGGLFDVIVAEAGEKTIRAEAILDALLTHLAPIWPGRLSLGGIGLGDTWRYERLHRDDATSGLVPFHKLSQWLAYSLIEPLLEAGLSVSGVDALTGLAEYRNGGLMIDSGIIVPRDPAMLDQPHEPASAFVVEWRALTVALLDRLAAEIRKTLALSAETLPLAKILEGGTWAAGRVIARTKRPDGGPPFAIVSDGTVF